ncbi:hypothetical protein T492DRAFT_924585 [Pavlovales sp. CCMP2436]|nr:hypothetical protein T492DRAFT_924585 [Pavlovales sp. CCMP2436]|mmetsp:Transcript_3516/g.8805  ORF Transcript_3516/g.8805 Transcript_3516/m.8805 type:complete len:452 (+) Transcript_3516:63-1418(+)
MQHVETAYMGPSESAAEVENDNSTSEDAPREGQGGGSGSGGPSGNTGAQLQEVPTRVWCRFPGCGKSYASNDGVRKHAKRYHVQWLLSMDANKLPVSDTNPPDGANLDDFDDTKPPPPRKRAKVEPGDQSGLGQLLVPDSHPSYGPAATLAGMATAGVGLGRPPPGPSGHLLSIEGTRNASLFAVGLYPGGFPGGAYPAGGYAGVPSNGCGYAARVPSNDPDLSNPRNPVVPSGPSRTVSGVLERDPDATADEVGVTEQARSSLGFWTHSMPPIKRGPSLLNQIEDEFDLRVADPGANPSMLLPLQQYGQHAQHAHLPQHGEYAQYQQRYAYSGAEGGGGCCCYGSHADAAAGLSALSSAALQHAAAVDLSALPPSYPAPALPARPAYYPGAQPPSILPNPSESALQLDVLDHAERSVDGPALRRDDSMVAHAAQAGRVPERSTVALEEFK